MAFKLKKESRLGRRLKKGAELPGVGGFTAIQKGTSRLVTILERARRNVGIAGTSRSGKKVIMKGKRGLSGTSSDSALQELSNQARKKRLTVMPFRPTKN